MEHQTQNQVQPQFTFEGSHMIMFHREPTGLPQMKDANVNDRDRMQDLLAQEKYLGVAYDISMNEAGHEELYQVFKQNHDTVHQLQRQLFSVMFKKGWYRIPVADAQSVAHTFDQFQQYQSQFPFPPQHQAGQSGAYMPSQPQPSFAQQQTTAQQQAAGQQQTATQQKAAAQQQQAAAKQRTAGSTGSEQQLNQQVDQALQQAERGKMPSYRSSSRRPH